jgi:hypothetical protein
MSFTHSHKLHFPMIYALVVLLLLGGAGCSALQTDSTESSQGSSTVMPPYLPSGVKDIQIPAELEMKPDDSMFINTSSYIGGILSYEGRVDMESLADFFVATMKKNGWKMTGSIRYKNVLMAFVKPHKSCLIKIMDTGLSMKTQVSIYYTEDVQNEDSSGYRSGEGAVR